MDLRPERQSPGERWRRARSARRCDRLASALAHLDAPCTGLKRPRKHRNNPLDARTTVLFQQSFASSASGESAHALGEGTRCGFIFLRPSCDTHSSEFSASLSAVPERCSRPDSSLTATALSTVATTQRRATFEWSLTRRTAGTTRSRSLGTSAAPPARRELPERRAPLAQQGQQARREQPEQRAQLARPDQPARPVPLAPRARLARSDPPGRRVRLDLLRCSASATTADVYGRERERRVWHRNVRPRRLPDWPGDGRRLGRRRKWRHRDL